MKLVAFALAAVALVGCKTHSSGSDQEIPKNNGSFIVDPSKDPAPVAVTGLEFTKGSPNSLIECHSTSEGDANCRLISKKFDILENPTGEEKTYKISYSNTCRIKGITADNVPTGIVVRAQPDSEGLVGGMIYQNRTDSFVLRGKGNVRVEVLQNASLAPLYEPGCGLTITPEVIAN